MTSLLVFPIAILMEYTAVLRFSPEGFNVKLISGSAVESFPNTIDRS